MLSVLVKVVVASVFPPKSESVRTGESRIGSLMVAVMVMESPKCTVPCPCENESAAVGDVLSIVTELESVVAVTVSPGSPTDLKSMLKVMSPETSFSSAPRQPNGR